MKITTIFGIIYLGLGLCGIEAQVVQDPLHDYYTRNFGKADFGAAPDSESPSPPITPETKIYCFEANFTGPEHKSIFITDQGESLGARGKYSWSIYCPVASGGYQLVTDDSHSISAGIGGPIYIGYIEQIKHYGIISGGKYSVAAYYLDNDIIQSKVIDLDREHANAEHYPQYFLASANDRKITTYTVAQLAQKYAGK